MIFEVLGVQEIIKKTIKNRLQIASEVGVHLGNVFVSIWTVFGGQVGRQNL